jgi:PAS domain S-box-containing protein
MLAFAGVATGIVTQTIWPVFWAVAATCLTLIDTACMRAALANPTSANLDRAERIMMVVGFSLVCVFVSLPTALMLSFKFEMVMGAMALFSAGATRSSTMFAVSQRAGLFYFVPYLLVPTLALGHHWLTVGQAPFASYLLGLSSLYCCLAYIRKSWLTRHTAELALDTARAEALVERDIAAREAAVSKLLFQHTTLRAALFDTEGRFIAVNPSWLDAIQKSESDILGKPFCEAMPDFETHWPLAITAALAGETTKVDGDARIRADKQKVYLDWEVQPWYTSEGKIGGAVAYAQDVTAVHMAREAARDKQASLELALKAMKAFIWEVDYVNKTVSFDEEATAFYGKEPTFEMVSKRDHSPIHPDDREISKRQALRIAKNGGYGRMEARHLQADGTVRWVRTDLAPKRYTNGMPTSFVMLTSEVTEEMSRHEKLASMMTRANGALSEKRKLLEELCGQSNSASEACEQEAQTTAPVIASDAADSTFSTLFSGFEQILAEIDDRDIALAAAVQQLRDARATAEAANIAKSQFLANMSHELRTPLNAIIGYTEILIEDAEYEQRIDAAKDATKVRNSATHLLGLINEILDLSKIEAGKMDIAFEPTPLIDVFNDVIASAQPLAAANNNKIIVDIACERTLAFTDGFRLRQCLLNMLSNACKFTQEGEITLRLEMSEIEGNNRWYDISVTDTGIGISQEQQLRLFKPFSQADGSTTRKYGGTGLGLALTREMTHLLGGEVFVQSHEGQGSMFTMRIPALGLEAGDVDMMLSANKSAPLVLVVDDDPLARALTARSAAALGMSIASAETGLAALSFCEQNDVDLVVLDLQLPDMDGNDVLAALRGSKRSRDIPVMVVSIDDDRRRSISAGAQEHLAKPCPSAVLTAAIARLIRRKEGDITPVSTDRAQAEAMLTPTNNKKKRSA